MKSPGVVDALARLLSDADLRRRFESDRAGVLAELGIGSDDAALLNAVDSTHLDHQADGLISKRQSEVARLIPMTWSELGSDGPELFARYAEQEAWPTGHKRHLHDAVAFCRYLKQIGSPALVPLDEHRLSFVTGTGRCRVRFSRERDGDGRERRIIVLFVRNRKGDLRQFILRPTSPGLLLKQNRRSIPEGE